MNNNLTLIKKLMAIPSPTSNRIDTDKILDLALEEFKGTDFTIEQFSKNKVRSALIYMGKTRPKRFRLLFTSHLDIIAETHPAKYHMKIDGYRISGSGVLDMKAGAAVAINVFKESAPKVKFPLGLQLTTDEEVGGFDGAKYQIDQGVQSDFVIATEPTNFNVIFKAKGILQAEITAKGTTAHSAYPWRGDNALQHLITALSKLQLEFPDPTEKDNWHTTLNIANVSTPNEAFNAVPDSASALIDIRFIPEDQIGLEAKVRNCLDESSELRIRFFDPPMNNSTNNSDIQLLAKTAQKIRGKQTVLDGANGSSDARFFAAAKTASVEFGLGGSEIHDSRGEWVSIKSIGIYEKILRDFLNSL